METNVKSITIDTGSADFTASRAQSLQPRSAHALHHLCSITEIYPVPLTPVGDIGAVISTRVTATDCLSPETSSDQLNCASPDHTGGLQSQRCAASARSTVRIPLAGAAAISQNSTSAASPINTRQLTSFHSTTRVVV